MSELSPEAVEALERLLEVDLPEEVLAQLPASSRELLRLIRES